MMVREDTNHGQVEKPQGNTKIFFFFPVMNDKLVLLIRKLKT